MIMSPVPQFTVILYVLLVEVVADDRAIVLIQRHMLANELVDSDDRELFCLAACN
jgi:hypothetical protein